MNDGFEQQWLSDLPTEWTEKRADFMCNPYRITVNPDKYGDDLVAHYSIPHVQETGGPDIEPASDIDSTKLLITEPTLLVSKLNPRKKTICMAEPHLGYPTLASSEFVAISSDQMDRRYAYYLWCSEKVTDRLSAIVQSATRSHQRVNPADILKLPWKWPPIDTQQRIARFLDEKTAQIDGLIEKKRALLDRLAEKRQALITRAVTKGFPEHRAGWAPNNIDDTNAEPHKAYATHGCLPEGWTRRRLRFDVRVNPKKSALDLVPEELVSFVPMDAVGEYGGLNLNEVRELGEVFGGYTYFADGDLCIAKITPCFENGKGAVAEGLTNGVGFGTTELHVVRPGPCIDRNFLFYVTIADDFRKFGESEMYGAGGQKRIDDVFIKDWMPPLPPLDDQRKIARFLDEKTRGITVASDHIERSIKLLDEYRSALITAAVTAQEGVLNGN